MSEELSAIYKKIAAGKGLKYEFLFSLEGLFLSVMDFDPVTDEPLPITVDDVLLNIHSSSVLKNNWQNDRMNHIVRFVSSAVRNLIDILHEKNLREHRITRPEQVREVDSKSMMWLAKKPGFTVKQKIASEQRMMGVYHTTSLDTAENRLFKAFMKNLDDLLLEKENACRKRGADISDDDERFTSVVHRWLKSDEADCIGRWNNTPPNNTLLNDKNYRKIWKAHLMLQNLSERIQSDLDNIERIKTRALFWLTAAKLNFSKDIRFRQTLLFPDYENLSLAKDAGLVGFAFDDSWEKFSVSANADAIVLSLNGKETEYSLPSDVENLSDVLSCAEQVCADFFPNKKFEMKILNQVQNDESKVQNDDGKIQTDKTRSVAAVDLNAVFPSFTLGDGTKGRFANKLVHQSLRFEQNKKNVWLPCSSSSSKLFFTKSKNIKTFSIHSFFDERLRSEIDSSEDKNAIEKACADFARITKETLRCQKCLYITSDDVDDFSPGVNAFKHSMNAAFSRTEILPRSIAAVFAKFSDVQTRFRVNDEITVRSMYDDYEIRTKIRIKVDEELAKKNPETKGISFQRLGFKRIEQKNQFPKNVLPQNLNRILTLQDANLLQGIFSADDFHFESKAPLKKLPAKENEIVIYADDDTSIGAIEYERLQNITPDIPLWCDFLPKLSMVDSSGKEYVLVEPEKVSIRPVVGKPVRIPISWRFIFPSHKDFYEFPLAQGDKKEKSKYFAFIKDSAFPLENDTECSLYLTYTYGMPLPYNLEFLPVSDSAEFKSVVVKWENKECEKDLIHIPGPEYVQEDSWEEVSNVKIKGMKQVDKIQQLLEVTQSLAKYGWNTFRIIDYIGSRIKTIGEASVFLLNNLDSNGNKATCFKSNFPENYNIQIGSEITCSFIPSINLDGSPRRDKYGQRGLQAYGAIVGGWEEKSNYFYYTLPLINLWNQGRSASDSDFPKFLFILVKELSDAAVLLLKNSSTQKSVKDEVCCMLAALHKDSPKELHDYLNIIIENTLSGNHEEPDSLFHHKRLINAFGFAMGNAELPWQRKMLDDIVDLTGSADEDMRDYGIEILGIALWRTQKCVANLSALNIAKILPAVVQAIDVFLKFYKTKINPAMKNPERFDNDSYFSIQVWLKRRLFLRSIELLIALYRVRNTSVDDDVLKLLAPTKENEQMNKLKSMFRDMEKFCQTDEQFTNSYNNKKRYRPLTSRLQFTIDEANKSIPNYLYVLEKYTQGEDCRIKILKINDDFD